MRICWLLAALLLVCAEQAAVAKPIVKQQGDLLLISNGFFDIGYDLHINKLGVRWDREEVIRNGVVGQPPALPKCGSWERTDTADGAIITIRPDDSGRFDFAIKIPESSSHFEISRPASSNADTFRGTLDLSHDQWIARLQKPVNGTNVIQMGSGKTSSLLCDGVYDHKTFKAIRISDTAGSSPVIKLHVDSATFEIPVPRSRQEAARVELKRDVLGERAAKAKSEARVKDWSHVPCGWCSWYCFYSDVNQEQVISNLEFTARHLAPYGLEYIQIDDGWQVSPAGDWEPNEKFPNGMKWLADQIHEKDLKAGLWMHPFMVHAQSNLAKQHPDWMLTKDGKPVYSWDKRIFALDASNPYYLQWLGKLCRKVSSEWNYDYVKLDNIRFDMPGDKQFDPGITHEEALLKALESICSDMKGTYIAGRMLPMPCVQGAGLSHSMRNKSDIKPEWESIVKNSRELAKVYRYHKSLWINDPDCLVVRSPLTEDQARIWASLLALTGGMMIASDDMPSLPPDRLDIVKKVMPVADIRPMDLFEHELPQIWDLKVAADWEQWDVAAVVNWEETDKNVNLSFSDLGLPVDTDYLVYDFWQDKLIGKSKKSTQLTLPAMSSKLIIIHPSHPRPQFLSSTRHVTQGLTDVKEVRWDGISRLLSGTVQGVALERTALTFYVPENFKVLSQDCSGATVITLQEGNLLKLMFRFNTAKPVAWTIRFGTK